jgi:hypothetical protein
LAGAQALSCPRRLALRHAPSAILHAKTLVVDDYVSIAEVLVYRRALTDAERQSLEGYLQGKYFGPAPLPVAPVSIRIEQLPDGQLRCRVMGEPKQAYEVLTSTDLAAWVPLLTQSAAADGTFEFTVTNSFPNGRQFFQARAVNE